MALAARPAELGPRVLRFAKAAADRACVAQASGVTTQSEERAGAIVRKGMRGTAYNERVSYGWVMLLLAAAAMVGTLPGRTQGLGLVTEPLIADLRSAASITRS